MKYLLKLAVLPALIQLAACTGMSALDQQSLEVSRKLLDGTEFGLTPGQRPPVAELTTIDAEMASYLEERVPAELSPNLKIRRILQALLDEGLELEYHNYKTFSAQETFYRREGNCMSFTNLFIALARESGLKVSYQEVEVPPSWGEQDGTWMFSKHINALVRLPDNDQVVDFNLADFRDDYPRHAITDRAAEARFHNNLGAHWMSEGDTRQAFLHFRHALQLDPDTGFFWTNLGSLYRRNGFDTRAEQAYLIAIKMSDEPAAMSNLARLYRTQGRDSDAEAYEDRVQFYRTRNPFYLYHLAEQAYAAGDYNKTRKLMQRAISGYDRSHEFHRLLGLSYAKLGKADAAEKEFQKALELAQGGEEEARYQRKLDLLAGR